MGALVVLIVVIWKSGCLEGVWWLSERCLEDVWRVSGVCWTVSGGYLWDVLDG